MIVDGIHYQESNLKSISGITYENSHSQSFEIELCNSGHPIVVTNFDVDDIGDHHAKLIRRMRDYYKPTGSIGMDNPCIHRD